MPEGLDHACRCGAVRLHISVPGRGAGTRIVCYCKDCQTAARLNGDEAEILQPDGGTDIWQTTPDRLEIVSGAELLEILRLSPKGLMRWHANCCGTPMLNTPEKLGLPFAGIVLRPDEAAAATKVLGRVTARAFTASAPPRRGGPRKDRNFALAGGQIVLRMIAALVSGRARMTPLRGADGGPVAPVRVIPKEARAAAHPDTRTRG